MSGRKRTGRQKLGPLLGNMWRRFIFAVTVHMKVPMLDFYKGIYRVFRPSHRVEGFARMSGTVSAGFDRIGSAISPLLAAPCRRGLHQNTQMPAFCVFKRDYQPCFVRTAI